MTIDDLNFDSYSFYVDNANLFKTKRYDYTEPIENIKACITDMIKSDVRTNLQKACAPDGYNLFKNRVKKDVELFFSAELSINELNIYKFRNLYRHELQYIYSDSNIDFSIEEFISSFRYLCIDQCEIIFKINYLFYSYLMYKQSFYHEDDFKKLKQDLDSFYDSIVSKYSDKQIQCSRYETFKYLTPIIHGRRFYVSRYCSV